MKRIMHSKTPWLAALWICCGTVVVCADDNVAQEENKQAESVQKIIQKVIKEAKDGAGDKSVSVNVERFVVSDGDGEPQQKGKIVIKTGDGKTQVFDLSDAVKKAGARVIRLDGDKLKEMELDIDVDDMKFDLMKNGAAFRWRTDGTDDAPQFMIGVQCEAVSNALRAHVDVPKNALIVSEVTEDGPAAKAGIRQYDIVTRVGDETVKSLDGLVNAIQKSKGEELTLTVLRKGEESQFTLKPAKRQQSAEISQLLKDNLHKYLGEGTDHILHLDVDGLESGKNFRFETMRPGIVLEASDDIEQVIERLPELMGRAINGDKRMEVRIRKSGRERGDAASRVRSIIRVQDDETHDHDADGDHEHGDKDEDEGHHNGDDDDDHHHAGGGHDNDDHAELAKQISQLSKEVERLQKSLKELKNKRD